MAKRASDLVLSRYKLYTFLACQRRFQLRFVTELPWPELPPDERAELPALRGDAFHRLLQRHWLGLPVQLPTDADAEVVRWWQAFERQPPRVPEGARHVELALSVPIVSLDGGQPYFLNGRYDLLVLGETHAHIFDWKTERRPRTADVLAQEWQTRLYLALLAEGGVALGRRYAPAQIALTYWFANAPQASVTLAYDDAQHARNWADLRALIGRIDRRMALPPETVWPLTDDLAECAACIYRNLCGRHLPAAAPDELEAEMALEARGGAVRQSPPWPGENEF